MSTPNPNDSIPRRIIIDLFSDAIKMVREEMQKRVKAQDGVSRMPTSAISFGAFRSGRGTTHDGIDLFVPEGTFIHAPAGKSILIGVCNVNSKNPTERTASQSIGNGLTFFVPDPEKPYFVQFAHISTKTFNQLKKLKIGIGSEISDTSFNSPVAIAGKSGITRSPPHLHIAATTEFMFGGKTHTAADFYELYKAQKLEDFLRHRNFFAIVPDSRRKNHMSLAGYIDPLKLIDTGRLRISSLPPTTIGKIEKEDKPKVLAVR